MIFTIGYLGGFISMLCYCKKCGRIAQEGYNEKEQICDYCNSIMQYIPEQFLIGKRGIALNKELEQQFIDEYIKSSPEFDQYLFDHRDEDLFNRRMENEAKLAHGRAVLEGRDKGNKFGIECPYCHATNVKKITNASKAVHTAVFGIFSLGRNSKQWHCNHCNSDF